MPIIFLSHTTFVKRGAVESWQAAVPSFCGFDDRAMTEK